MFQSVFHRRFETRARTRALAVAALVLAAVPGTAAHAQDAAGQQLAFPSAEGFGRFAKGARGGSVYHVTQLGDSGPGSFRDAVSQPDRTIVFDLGGVIRIGERIAVAKRTTIAGQTAPGDGITIYGNGLSFSNSDDTVVRFLRVRMGRIGDSGKDAITIAEGSQMIFDHVSVSWGRDENFSISGPVQNVTLQNSIVAQGLDTHSCGGLIQTDGGVSILRTLYIDNHTRNPKVKGLNQFVNNVVYDWRVGAYILGDSAGLSQANVSGNYFIEGPERADPPFTRANANFSLFADQNFHDANRNGALDGALIPQAEYGPVTWVATPFDQPPVRMVAPEEAFAEVVRSAGASLVRDAVDRALIDELTSLGTRGAVISDEATLPTRGPGELASGTTAADTDRDGMPDAWERANRLDPADPEDRNGDLDGDGYTNLEEYLQLLAGEGDGVGSDGL